MSLEEEKNCLSFNIGTYNVCFEMYIILYLYTNEYGLKLYHRNIQRINCCISNFIYKALNILVNSIFCPKTKFYKLKDLILYVQSIDCITVAYF